MDESSIDSKFSGLGIAALVFGIFAISTCWFSLFSYSYFSMFVLLTFPLYILSITFGAVSYWGKTKDKAGLIGFILGIVAFAIVIIYIYIQILGTHVVYSHI